MNSNAQKAELKILFLGEFVKKLILANKPGLFETLEIQAKKQSREAAEKAKREVAEDMRKLLEKEQIMESRKISFPAAQPPSAVVSAMKAPAVPQPSAWNKLYAFINDPAIIAIECAGAGISVSVNRRGIIQKTPIALSEEEIKELMKDLAQKTRIPLLPGIFKVAYQNLIITAFISEFVGTKFLIQKRAVFPLALPATQPYQPSPYKPMSPKAAKF